MAIIEYKTRMAQMRTGVFTSWLKTLQPEDGGRLRFVFSFVADTYTQRIFAI